MDKTLKQLEAACAAAGATLTQKGPGHYHIQGEVLVNYYPLSAKRTAFLAGTTKGQPATIEEAVAMAFKSAPLELDTSSTYTIHGRLVDEAEFRAYTATLPSTPGIPWKESP